MKFVQRDMGEAAEASNPGSNGMRREIVFLICTTGALLLAAFLSVGWLVERVLPLISAEREKAWFQHFSISTHAVEPQSEEERLRVENAQKTLERLTALSGVVGLEYRLVLLADATPNAFAFPGGTIGVTRGMLKIVDDEISLAFVLGHELGHFAQRDHLRGIGRALGRALVLALLFGDMGETLSSHSTTLLDLAHSRRAEASADLFSLALVHRAFGKTDGVDKLFQWLETRERTPAWTTWLQTHPNSGERNENLRAAANQLAPSTH